jgi:hypothetical protein
VKKIAVLIAALALSLQAYGAQFTLSWTDNSTNESGFRIERSSNGTTFTEIATVGVNAVSYVDAGLPNSTTYWYRVRAYNSAGNSGYSNVASGTTPPPANTAPTVSDIANGTFTVGVASTPISFTVGDAQTSASALTVTVASSNTTVLPVASIVLGGSGANRTLVITPAAAGTSTVTVTVSDGTLTATDTFVVTAQVVVPGSPVDLSLAGAP